MKMFINKTFKLNRKKKIDDCIELLQNADPTGEIQPDSQEMLDLEEECYMMGPLIDKKLQDIDEQHAELEDLNLKILEAFQLYNNLMKESISKQSALINNNQMSTVSMAPGPGSGMTNGGVSFAAAPPSLDANSLNFAHKLNSMVQAGAGTGGYSQLGNGYQPQSQPAGSFSAQPANSSLSMGQYPNQYMTNTNGTGLVNQSTMTSTNGTSVMPGLASVNSQPQMAGYGNFN